MTAEPQDVQPHGVEQAPQPTNLADVVEVILDKGIVIDAYVRVALVGIELLTIDARIVVASIDTYLRYAREVRELGIQQDAAAASLPGMFREGRETDDEPTSASGTRRARGSAGGG